MEDNLADWVSALVAGGALTYALLRDTAQAWITVPRLKITEVGPYLITRRGKNHLEVAIVVKNGTRFGRGAEKVSVGLRKVAFVPADNVFPHSSETKRSLITWQDTNSETAIAIPRGVSERVVLFAIPELNQAPGNAGIAGTAAPPHYGTGVAAAGGTNTGEILFIGDGDYPRRAGKYTIWFLVNAESVNSLQYMLTLRFNGTWPATSDQCSDVISDVKIKKVN